MRQPVYWMAYHPDMPPEYRGNTARAFHLGSSGTFTKCGMKKASKVDYKPYKFEVCKNCIKLSISQEGRGQ